MIDDHYISDEYLNAFIDNQLDTAERIKVFKQISQSNELRDRVCDISGVKEMLQHAYPLRAPDNHTHNRSHPLWNKSLQAMAASVLLLLGGVTGWVANSWTIGDGTPYDLQEIVQQTPSVDATNDSRKLIIHVSNSNNARIKAALDETESLLEAYKQQHHPIQVELIANKKGVEMFRASTSQYEKRILSLHNKYPNLKLLACGTTIGKMRNKGENVQLLPHVDIAPSAAEKIHERIEQGWSYTRI